ncbi:MAG: hypothetical protein HOF74_11690 [Gammaproteobacteria bacterium]|nr:hypothetical protein [Gammaproteobacteria bacterium]MBT3860488.1 hypothetical protein [Gammaproteobacteria bacterium]MBT3987937.1 hypothetical protein [Gammaproteobacteria bacterium]MBT4256633.1 hypothetical protein [Gammaproteobacteria bacterium]MBT4582464.1 hypothetical protein [Gammaproteobacteria bacterium]
MISAYRRTIGLLFFIACVFSNTLLAQERIQLADESILNVFLIEPTDGVDQPSPLLILMAGGPGNASISRDTSQWLGSGFARRGWMVAVPISPNNRSFRGAANNNKIKQLIVELKKRDDVATGKALLAGVSNGGMSALEIARREPQNYFGVAAVPAVSADNTNNESLNGFPVYLRIGGDDQLGWADQFDSSVESLSSAGVDLDADILYGAPHMFRMEWDTLEPWLERFNAQ